MSEMEYPDRGDLVVVKVTQILDYGVFLELLEYDKAKGFIHISNVSSSWVKNIRNFVKANQVRVAKVLNIDTEKRQIDLSFAGVSPQREKQKLTEFKQVNREEKLILILAKQELDTYKKMLKILNDHSSLYMDLFGEKEKVNSLVEVEILKDVPTFVGTDMKEYGPFSKGNRVGLPKKVSKLFITRKIAKEL